MGMVRRLLSLMADGHFTYVDSVEKVDWVGEAICYRPMAYRVPLFILNAPFDDG